MSRSCSPDVWCRGKHRGSLRSRHGLAARAVASAAGRRSDHAPRAEPPSPTTAGFALGPLAAGLLAQWAPAPRACRTSPTSLMALVLLLLRNAPETVAAAPTRSARLAARHPQPTLPPSRGADGAVGVRCPAIAFALLPSVVEAEHAADGIALTAAITALVCARRGAIQPLGRRLDDDGRRQPRRSIGPRPPGSRPRARPRPRRRPATVWLLVPSAIVLGSAYGLCLVAGLVEIQRRGSAARSPA